MCGTAAVGAAEGTASTPFNGGTRHSPGKRWLALGCTNNRRREVHAFEQWPTGKRQIVEIGNEIAHLTFDDIGVGSYPGVGDAGN